MLDIRLIRDEKPKIDQMLTERGLKLSLDEFNQQDTQWRALKAEIDKLRSQQNKSNEQVASIKKSGGNLAQITSELKVLSQKIDELSAKVGEIEYKTGNFIYTIPNIPHPSVPKGRSPADNQVIREWGKKKAFDFKPKTHFELGEALGILDLERAAKISGSGFVVHVGNGARLQRALIHFMLDLHTRRHGYQEIWPPALVNRAAMTGTGQLPNLEADMYKIPEDDLFLVPTAEVPLTNLHRDEILDESQLPVCYTAYTPCFRREAGSYGKQTRGMVRVHQFDKVELVKLVRPDTSYDEHEKLLANVEAILQMLGLHYRVVLLCTADLSFAAAKCYDLEVWCPGVDQWLEVSSCSNFEDFQARRAGIRYRPKGGKAQFVHTLNASGVALARTVVALYENYQTADGRIEIPPALQPYMDNLKHL